MAEILFATDTLSLVALAAIHLAAGVAVGVWFRFGALLPLFAIIVVESIVGDVRLGIAPWYLLLLAGLVLVQFGYAISARLSRFRRVSETGPSVRVSTPK
jgi:hypothetical protein